MVCDSCGAEIADPETGCTACDSGASDGGASNAGPAAGLSASAAGAAFPPPAMSGRATDATGIIISAPDPIEVDEELFAPTPSPPPPPDDGRPGPVTIATHDADATMVSPMPGVGSSAAGSDGGGAAATATLDRTAEQTGATTTAPVTRPITTVFDGNADVAEHPPERPPFKIRLVFVFAFFGAIAAALVPASEIVDIRTTRPVDGITIGAVELDDIATNLAIAAYVGVGVMVLGGLIACWGFRWAAGLAGGAGLAVVGWSALVIGLVEARIEVAEEVTRTSAVGFTLEVTRDLGYWLIVAAAAVGTVVFVFSLRLSRTGGRPGFNPWIGAIGAVSTLVLAAGPLLPVNGASFGDNFWITNGGDLPIAFFVGRLGQIALLGIFGAIGFLLVRWFGVGFAAGAVCVAAWMWFSSLAELGDAPIGIAWRNPGATDTTPHAVTTVGMVLTVVMLLAAVIIAAVQHRRVYHR